MSSAQSLRSSASRLRALLDPAWRRVRARFTVDTRALAALRIVLGLTLLGDLLHRAQYLELFYTDSGAYPLSAVEVTYTQYNGLSLHALSGAAWFQQLLFVVAGLFAVAFILGYRTRLVGLVSLALLFSLHARNPAVLNGGDRMLRVVLLVSLVAPIGERWSIDALRRGTARKTVTSFGTAAVLVQPIAVFTANAALKHQGETWYAGDGLKIALRNDTMSYLLGNELAEFPALMTVLNYGWVTLLAGSSVFLLLTAGRLRALAVFPYLAAFAGMATTMAVGVFPFALAASVLPYLTSPFWDALARRVPERWLDRLPTAAALGPLGRPPTEHRLLDALRNRGYDSVAGYTAAYARSLLTVVGLATLLWIVVFTAYDNTDYENPIAFSNHLDQQDWGLYAPNPSDAYSWYVPEATLSNGSAVHALDGGPTTFDRPPDASDEYDSFRHRKFLQTVRNSGAGSSNGAIARGYHDWVCDRATDSHGDSVERVTVYRMYQPSPVDGSYDSGPTKLKVIEGECAN
jgi:hypothetical protein